jgi:hypothetical protein
VLLWCCEDEKVWRWEGAKMRRWEDVKMRRWRCEDDVKMKKMWRWEDEKLWRWEDVKMRSCEDEKMRYRPPLLEEPCAQTLSGKTRELPYRQMTRETGPLPLIEAWKPWLKTTVCGSTQIFGQRRPQITRAHNPFSGPFPDRASVEASSIPQRFTHCLSIQFPEPEPTPHMINKWTCWPFIKSTTWDWNQSWEGARIG